MQKWLRILTSWQKSKVNIKLKLWVVFWKKSKEKGKFYLWLKVHSLNICLLWTFKILITVAQLNRAYFWIKIYLPIVFVGFSLEESNYIYIIIYLGNNIPSILTWLQRIQATRQLEFSSQSNLCGKSQQFLVDYTLCTYEWYTYYVMSCVTFPYLNTTLS